MTLRVLIADDSAVARVTIARRVRALGVEVELVERDSCATASTVDATTLICALLDFDLGDGFGIEIAAQLRATHVTLPIAFFSSTLASEISQLTAAYGPLFRKPDDLDAAVDWIKDQTRA